MKKVGYLGPEGTFTQEAAIVYTDKRQCELVEYNGIPELIYAVDTREIDEAVVPVENAIEGTVNVTIDILIHDVEVKICGELILPIHHCLLVRRGVKAEDIRLVLSHPQALAQCRKFIYNNLKGIDVMPVASTAAAARQVKHSDKPWAAIATRRAADIFHLEILYENIQEHDRNSTRFIILSKEDCPPTGKDKTSIVFTVNDRPGSLFHALKIFADRDINLTKIESRPMKTFLGQYLFLVDFEGHRCDYVIREALDVLSAGSKYFKVLGSYPRCEFYCE